MLSEEQTESFLVNSESVSGLSFPTASGVDVGGVGKAIVGSIGFAFALGINTLINAVSTAYAGLIDGVRGSSPAERDTSAIRSEAVATPSKRTA